MKYKHAMFDINLWMQKIKTKCNELRYIVKYKYFLAML